MGQWVARVKPSEEVPDAEQDDLALVRRAQMDPLEFPLIFHRYWSLVCRYLSFGLGSRDDAEDAAQLVMIEVARRLPEFSADHPKASFRSWVMTIAHSRKVDALRASKRNRYYAIPEEPQWPSPTPSPEEAAGFALAQEWMLRLLAHLPADQRAVMELRAVETQTHEIAYVLGLSEANVRKLTQRARDRLRPLLAGEFGGGYE